MARRTKPYIVDATTLLGCVVLERNQFAGVIVKIETVMAQLLFTTDSLNEYTCLELKSDPSIEVQDPKRNMVGLDFEFAEFAPLETDPVMLAGAANEPCPFHVGQRLWDNIPGAKPDCLGAVKRIEQVEPGFYLATTHFASRVDSEDFAQRGTTHGRPTPADIAAVTPTQGS